MFRLGAFGVGVFCYFFAGVVGVSAAYPQLVRSPSVRMIDGNLLVLETFERTQADGQKKRYSILKISMQESQEIRAVKPLKTLSDLDALLASVYVPNMIQFVTDFVAAEYKARGSLDNLAAIQQERSFLNTPATWVIVTEENDLRKIQSVMRVVRREMYPPEIALPFFPGHGSQTYPPTDAEVNRSVNELEQFMRDSRTAALFDAEKRMGLRLEDPPQRLIPERNIVTGNWAEIKSMVKSKEAPEEDLVSLMLYSLIQDGMHLRPEGWFDVKMERSVRSENGVRISWSGGPLNSDFVIEAVGPLRRLWERRGFKVLQYFKEHDTYVMTSSLEEFEKHNGLRAKTTAPHLVESLQRAGPWAWYPVLPPVRYAKPGDPRLDAPSLDLGQAEVRCHHLLGSLRIPFYLPGDQPLEYQYRIKP
jgi:hypothetical protein